MKDETRKHHGFIGRQLALGFGSVSIVAVLMCGMLLAAVWDVAGLIAQMREHESSIRLGLELTASTRELSMHIAHTVIEANDSHLEHYAEWREKVAEQIKELRPITSDEEVWRLNALRDVVDVMDDRLMNGALPAALAGEMAEARSIHREIEELGEAAAGHADALAGSMEGQMIEAHKHATMATRLGLMGSGLCIVLVASLAVGFTLRLRAAVLKPLAALTEAARRFGGGDFEPRLGHVGRGELADLGEAFDRMAEEIRLREHKLVRKERMAALGQFAAGIAHELNNPLGIVRGYLKTMKTDTDIETLREELAILDEETSHCQRIAEDLLSYAQATEIVAERIEMRDFLRESAKRFREGMDMFKNEVRVEAGEGLVAGDASRLRQVVLNLLVNACQISPAESPVILRGYAENGTYRIEVEDRGPGIPAENRERIFEPFFTRRKGGSGLGLSVCQGIVRGHAGSIEVLDAPGGGALFRVCLPTRRTTGSGSGERVS